MRRHSTKSANIRPFGEFLREDSGVMLVQQFPYGVIYAVEGRTIYVAAVMHVKRKPGYWASRNKLS